MLVTTTHGDMDDSLLVKRDGVVDNENEHIEWVEYCLVGCDGESHRTGVPDKDGCMCSKHVHRSARGVLKGMSMLGQAAKLGG